MFKIIWLCDFTPGYAFTHATANLHMALHLHAPAADLTPRPISNVLEDLFKSIEELKSKFDLPQTESKCLPTCRSDENGSAESLRPSDSEENAASTAQPFEGARQFRGDNEVMRGILTSIRVQKIYAKMSIVYGIVLDQEYSSKSLEILKRLVTTLGNFHDLCRNLNGRLSVYNAKDITKGVEGFKAKVRDDIEKIKNEEAEPTETDSTEMG